MAKDLLTLMQRITLISGLVFLVAYSLPIIFEDLPSNLVRLCITLQVAIWIIFALDYLVNLKFSINRLEYVKQHLFELAAVILPMLRPLRAIRALTAIVFLAQKAKRSRTHRLMSNTASIALGTWFISGLAITQAERNVPGSTIQSVRDGWWWSLETMTTVGYGDKLPTTLEGQAIGAALMLIGIGLLGTITASVASIFLTSVEDLDTGLTEEINQNEIKLDRVLSELALLKEALANSREQSESSES